MFRQGKVPLDWLRGVIVPIHKDGNKKEPLNYRPITLLSIAGKVYTGILQARLMNWCEKNNIIVIEQGGFRPGRGCPEQLYTLTELIKLRRRRKEMTYACFIDIRKAYDTVWHDGLKMKLIENGITGPMYRAICSLYSGCESTVRLDGQLGYTDFFPIETGVRQGCILSPLLYSIFINDLAKTLKQTHAGASIDTESAVQLCVLLYADDIVILADDMEELEYLMSIVHDYSVKWRFEVNHSKCGLMRFNVSGNAIPTEEIKLGPKVVPWVATYKYLGVELHNGVPFREYKKRALASATRAGHRVAGMGMYSGKLSVPLGIQVYQTLVRPLMEYAAEIVSLTPWHQAEQLQLTMAKRILQCSTRTMGTAVMGELGWWSMEARYQQLRVAFWGKLQRMPIDSPARQVYDATMELNARTNSGDYQVPAVEPSEGWEVHRPPTREISDHGLNTSPGMTLWCTQLKCDLYQLGLSKYWLNPSLIESEFGTHHLWRSKVKKVVGEREQARWWKSAMNSDLLRTYRILKEPIQLQREFYLTVPHGGWNDRIRIGRCALTRLRCGTNELRIHTGRMERLEVEDRLCPFCIESR